MMLTKYKEENRTRLEVVDTNWSSILCGEYNGSCPICGLFTNGQTGLLPTSMYPSATFWFISEDGVNTLEIMLMLCSLGGV